MSHVPGVNDTSEPSGNETHQIAATSLRQTLYESVRFIIVAQITHLET